jgi:hypothetical protein
MKVHLYLSHILGLTGLLDFDYADDFYCKNFTDSGIRQVAKSNFRRSLKNNISIPTRNMLTDKPQMFSIPGAHFVRALFRRLAPEQGTSPYGSAVKPMACRPLHR